MIVYAMFCFWILKFITPSGEENVHVCTFSRRDGGTLCPVILLVAIASEDDFPLVAQWIERRSSKALIWVRFLSRGLPENEQTALLVCRN